MSFARFFSRPAPTPQIRTDDSIEVASSKLAELLTNELSKKDIPYLSALKEYIHYLNQSFATMQIEPVSLETFKHYTIEAIKAAAIIEPYSRDLADSLYNYIAVLRYGVKVELAKQRRKLQEFSSRFPAVPDSSLDQLKRRLNALKASGGRRKTIRRKAARKTTRRKAIRA